MPRFTAVTSSTPTEPRFSPKLSRSRSPDSWASCRKYVCADTDVRGGHNQRLGDERARRRMVQGVPGTPSVAMALPVLLALDENQKTFNLLESQLVQRYAYQP